MVVVRCCRRHVPRYGCRSWSLWGKRVDWADCKEALASIGAVAQDVIDRLLAEFHEEDLYMSYYAFDLDAWAKVISASTPDASTGRRLHAALRKMSAALQSTREWRTWQVAAKQAIGHRARVVEQLRALGLEARDLEFRMAWRAAMGMPDVPKSLLDVVHFYLATWDGTGAVERGLGQDAAIQKQHVGQRARGELDADLYSALLELRLDGPQTEAEMFTSSDGVLLLTQFSRACAQQWLQRHRRIFSCYKVRKDVGTRRPERRKGTDLAVQQLARSAYQTQCEMAKVDGASASTPGRRPRRQTVFGIDRAKLMSQIRRLAKPSPGKKTQRYRRATVAKRAEKQAAGTWCGWNADMPKPRLGGSAAVEAATKCAATNAIRAKLWLSGRSRMQLGASTPKASQPASSAASDTRTTVSSTSGVVSVGTWKRRRVTPQPQEPSDKRKSGTPAADQARNAKFKSASASTPGATKLANKNEHVIGTSLESMIKQRVTDPDSTTLLAWLKAIAHGGLVKCNGRQMALRPGL